MRLERYYFSGRGGPTTRSPAVCTGLDFDAGQEAASACQHVVKDDKTRRTIHRPQNAILRVAAAMVECRTNDFFVLVALESAIRDEIDLLELLPAPTRAPAKSTRLAAVALA